MVHHLVNRDNLRHPSVNCTKFTKLTRGLNSFSRQLRVPGVTKCGFETAHDAHMKGEQEKVVRRPVYCRSFGLITVNFIQRKSEGKSDRTEKEKNDVKEKVTTTADIEVKSTATTVSKI